MILTSEQVLRVLARLEGRGALTYRQLRDLEARGCVAPAVMPGAKGPRVYGLDDVLVLRLLVRLQRDELLARWQSWAVVANLRGDLVAAMRGRLPRVLVVQGAIGRLVAPNAVERLSGVPFELSTVAPGVREAMSAEAGDVWSGFSWVTAREAHALMR